MKHQLGIIGYGGIGSWHFNNITERIPNIKVKGIYDIRKEATDKARENNLYVYDTLDDLLNDKDIDIVTIATPNDFHKDLSIKCLQHGKNVICEKPVTMNAAELEEIIQVSKETGKLFSVHQNRRWDKDYKIIEKILADHTIGDAYFIESRVLGSRQALHGWRGYAVNGGGMVYDWGVHLFDQLLNLIKSPVVSVSAHLFSAFSTEVDDNFKAFLQFENGISAVVEVSTNCFIHQPRWHVSGKEGTVVINNWDCEGKIVKLATDKTLKWEDDIVYTAAGPTRTMAPRPDETTKQLELPSVETDWANYYKNIIDVLDNKAELIVTPEQALRVMRLIDVIFESSKTGNPLTCKI
ncbi:MAG TPA: Gfo/Idh/MocA family oxidoreductase [Epulopiscium sp.]|nr:Gfo/Idh/MocA family oxidoreductase [Candidatus Epulonipiscium sp.]